MSAQRLVIYMPDGLVDVLNRATAASPQSRSEIICQAVERFLVEAPALGRREPAGTDEAFFDREAEIMMQSGLLQPGDFADSASAEPRPKSKLWIN